MGPALIAVFFLDASAIIFLVEDIEPAAGTIRQALRAGLATGGSALLAVSALSRLECRVLPVRIGDQQRLAAYDDFFGRDRLVVVPLSDGVIALATDVRTRSRLRTPDALQAACCLSLPDSARFVTGNTGFRREPALDLLLV